MMGSIDKQATIDAIRQKAKEELVDVNHYVRSGVQLAMAVVMGMPEQRWIPCSERLPEKPNVYTVTDSNDRVVRFVFTGTDSSREYWKRCAKAWMPLPTPYREE